MKKIYIFILLILPAVLVITASLLRYANGPYWISYNSDPAYLYLVNSLALAESKEAGNTGHPGTTIQILGAATMKIAQVLDFSEKDSLEFAVLKNPEFYLTSISIVLLIFNTLLLFIIGLVTFKLTKNIWLSLLLQFSPFLSNVILTTGLASVRPEPLLFFSSLLFLLILVKMVFSNNLTKSAHWYIIAFALASGFGMATKLIFFPLLLIPFIVLPGFRNKLVFLFLTGVCFVLWTWPIISQYTNLFEWYYSNITHTGYYGLGEAGLINSEIYLLNIKNLFLGNPLFLLIWLFSIVIIFRFRRSMSGITYKILVAVAVAQLTAVLIISKHGYDYYFLPVLNLQGFTLILIFLCLRRIDYFSRFNVKKVVISLGVFFVLSGLWRVIDIRKIFIQHMEIKHESLMICQKLKDEFKDYLEIIPLRASSPVGALAFGNYISNGGLYSESLQKIYGEKYFYNGFEGKFHTWTKELFIEDIISKGYDKKIVFMGPAMGEYIDVLCKTGLLFRNRSVLMREYGALYVFEGIIGTGKFERISLTPEKQ